MSQSSKQIFISYASSDVKMEYVEAVAKAIKRCGYSPYFMKSELRDATKGQDYLSKQILQSILMLVLMDLRYAEGVKYEFEEVAKRGEKIGAYVFLKKYADSAPEHIAQDAIIKHGLKDVNYCRDFDLTELSDVVEKNLSDWVKKEMARRKEKKRAKARKTILGILAVLAVPAVCFWWAVHYTNHEVEPGPPVPPYDTIPHKWPPRDTVRPIEVEELNPTPKPEPKPKPKPGLEPSVAVPNTFAVVCDDELFGAGICDAVSQISPSITQSVDTSKAQWTISVKHSVQDIPKMLESDALQVEVSYIVNLKNNTENGKIITKTIKKRGRSIIQDKDDAIRNANEEAAKEIANILNQYKNENI